MPFGLTEPGAGSDVASIQTKAVRRGDDYVINGAKTFITNAGHAAWTVVFAKTEPALGSRGLSAFIVPMDTPGVVIERKLSKMGQRATNTAAFALEDVVVPAANRLGGEGDGFKIAMATLDKTRPTTAAGALGVARAAYEHARDYVAERKQFGRPIGANQGVSFPVVDMATKIEAARPPSGRPLGCSTRVPGARRPRTRRWPSGSPPRPPWRSRRTRCRSSGATAT